MKQLLSGKKIIKTFGVGEEKHRVLNEVSVTIGSGEFVSIMGPSGSGKSTLLYALSGMDGIDSGEVAFEGRRLSGLSDDALSDLRRNRMGFVFQQPTLLKNLNILDNIILPQTRDRKRNVKQLTAKARLLMRQMGIEDLEERDITQASGGQLQRAGICRALMGEPGILFGDEPTGALNTKAAKEIMELFTKINQDGIAILLVTHDPNIAARTERVLFLSDGEIVDQYRLSKYTERDFDKRVSEIIRRMQKMEV
ncbi:ABC transporter ATP-binding protein [Enterocloster aldenensis]|uniref:ABC transporter ATP-binding protein n=1 Tax=Enterocloster aldenensis TaxID=358742 RepID=UPI0025A3D615|nr:ABC transporter ATP-binding protein [Enterocloster aldenensis]